MFKDRKRNSTLEPSFAHRFVRQQAAIDIVHLVLSRADVVEDGMLVPLERWLEQPVIILKHVLNSLEARVEEDAAQCHPGLRSNSHDCDIMERWEPDLPKLRC